MNENGGTPVIDSNWTAEVRAIFRKEALCELRTRSGLLTAALFSCATVTAVSLTAFNRKLTPTGGAGLFWVALLFAAILILPRAFTLEAEQRTGDLLRLWARPHAVFWGKALFNLAQILAIAILLAFLFLLLTDLEVRHVGLFVLGIFGSSLALAGGVTLCGALVAAAPNRGLLAGTLALPLLIPLILFGVAAVKVAFGDGGFGGGLTAAIGLFGYGILSMAIGPYLYAAVWE
jgi:heme exporter protein B